MAVEIFSLEILKCAHHEDHFCLATFVMIHCMDFWLRNKDNTKSKKYFFFLESLLKMMHTYKYGRT